jgi:hypothetical protein
MKKLTLHIFILTALLLSACGGKTTTELDSQDLAAPEVSPSSENSASSAEQPAQQSGEPMDMADREVSELTRLLVGLFKLEGTDLALSAEQATALIPLLNSLMELSQNQNAAPQQQAATPEQSDAIQERQDALMEQIKAVLTANQLNSITSLELDQEAVIAFMEEQGLSIGGGQPGQGTEQTMPEGTPPTNQAGNAPQVQGTPGSGGPGGNPQDGSAPVDGQITPGAGQAGGQAGRGGGSGSTSRVLMEALLQLLETKVNS